MTIFNKTFVCEKLTFFYYSTFSSQAGFRFDRSCVDNIFILNEVIQGRLQEGKKTFCFFLDIKKAYDTVWRDGL